jgi:hypothetical protein
MMRHVAWIDDEKLRVSENEWVSLGPSEFSSAIIFSEVGSLVEVDGFS